MASKNRDEDKLRKRLVSALREVLTKNDSELFVEDVHGVGEHGLDIVFLSRDCSGEKHCFGIQVKAVNISCHGHPTKDVKEIIGQLTIASGYDYKFQTDNTYEFSGFYVVTDKEISEVAKRYISSSFKHGRPIYYFYGSRLEKFLLDNENKNITEL
ncbi:MAG: hypothetical protein A3B38_00345 [Candidatus Levybacteria bacterium RIFCSPLOWO2_01_FULL_36_13]|nr:MAG: hypothetical protein A3B38_00345 [Candidatus Levybacteria bacterium RIFCSPLOWO2_01_FULL_36_13]